MIIEFEPATRVNGAANDMANVRNAIDRMAERPSFTAVYNHTVRFVKLITGFDRVMLYKFGAEAESYLLDRKTRLETAGPNVLLTAKVYTAMALVIHEMMTNSAKYGPLSSTRGKVRIDWSPGG